jgi:hypothetical protein
MIMVRLLLVVVQNIAEADPALAVEAAQPQLFGQSHSNDGVPIGQ